ncbi:MAG TPA: serine/threonine-protein kinase [Polyangiaceae bacterium]|nr:serine/threonine-protein kinase [Polyangiaceae bacterium]
MVSDPSDDVERHSERAGELVAGKYRIESEIGSGGMGVVYKAYREDLHSYVALKLLRTAFGFDPQTIARFLQEARTAAALKSPHVARVQDFGTLALGADRGARPYIVMEYLTGQDLGEVLQQETLRGEQLSVGEVVDYVIQACHAIAEAHSRGIVHRDLKPANLFRTDEHEIKVLDFGIAKPGYAPTSRLTRAGLSLGSPHYMSPEQVDSPKNVDSRADIYSFGICLYELLSGIVPYNGETFAELVPRIVSGTPIPLQDLRPGLPVGLADAVHRAFARAPQDRYQKVEELVGALAPFAPPRSRRLIELLAPLQAPTPMEFVRAVSTLPPAVAFAERVEPIELVERRPERHAARSKAVPWLVAGIALFALAVLFFMGSWLMATPHASSAAASPSELDRPARAALRGPAEAVPIGTVQPSAETASRALVNSTSTPSASAPERAALKPAPIARPAAPSSPSRPKSLKAESVAPRASQSAALNLDNRGRQ